MNKLTQKICPLVLISLFSYTSCTTPFYADETLADTPVLIFDKYYYGEYTGETAQGLPDGTGSLTSDLTGLTISGSWKKGIPAGNVVITRADGTVLEGKFKNGRMSGSVKQINPDQSYSTYGTKKGKPSGFISLYNAADECTGWDAIYQMTPIRELTAKCETVPYEDLLGADFMFNPITLSAEVQAVFENKNNAIALCKDAAGHYYYVTYRDVAYASFSQAIAPNLEPGDQVTVSGYYIKTDCLDGTDNLGLSALNKDVKETAAALSASAKRMNSYADTEALEVIRSNSLPYIRAFLITPNDADPADRLDPDYSYESVLKNPYVFANQNCEFSGTVVSSTIDTADSLIEMFVADDKDQGVYYVRFKGKAHTSFSAGSHVTIRGTYNGNYKEQVISDEIPQKKNDTENMKFPVTSCMYIIYPRIAATEIVE